MDCYRIYCRNSIVFNFFQKIERWTHWLSKHKYAYCALMDIVYNTPCYRDPALIIEKALTKKEVSRLYSALDYYTGSIDITDILFAATKLDELTELYILQNGNIGSSRPYAGYYNLLDDKLRKVSKTGYYDKSVVTSGPYSTDEVIFNELDFWKCYDLWKQEISQDKFYAIFDKNAGQQWGEMDTIGRLFGGPWKIDQETAYQTCLVENRAALWQLGHGMFVAAMLKSAENSGVPYMKFLCAYMDHKINKASFFRN